MVLLVGFYREPRPDRAAELLECLRRNCEHPGIELVTVFIEDDGGADMLRCWQCFRHPKMRIIEHGERVTYSFLFRYANRHFPGCAVIIANSDIFFDETLELLEDTTMAGKLLCLSRWDQGADGTPRLFANAASQDAWIFVTPVPEITADFCLGIPGCDNRVAWEAEKAGLTLSNPSRSVRARHLHGSAVRHYDDRYHVTAPYRTVEPSFLDKGPPPCPSAADFPSHRGRTLERELARRYRNLVAAVAPHLGGVVQRSLLREIRLALSRCLENSSPPHDAPFAVVAFREPMGYTLATLQAGVSTHNNDLRPLMDVPQGLAGLTFTQVVANRAAPVEIRFCSGGRLYLLADPGWEGYAVVAPFLDDAGWREPAQALTTTNGTVFHLWTLAATAGERLVVPTQVMLASTELIPSGGELWAGGRV